MATKIGEYKGYAILYDSQNKVFKLLNAEGDEVGMGVTQEVVEKQADTLSKTRYPLPIPIFNAGGERIKTARITSVNPTELTVWVVDDDINRDGYKGREKVSLVYSPHLYERTEANEGVATIIEAKTDAITQLRTEVKQLIATLEKPINPAYFGLKY